MDDPYTVMMDVMDELETAFLYNNESAKEQAKCFSSFSSPCGRKHIRSYSVVRKVTRRCGPSYRSATLFVTKGTH